MKLTSAEPIVIETERLLLSELTPKLLHELFTECSDEEIITYMGFASQDILDAEKKKFRKGISSYYYTFKNFRILDKTDQKVLGRCDFHTWVRHHRRAEIGYHLLDESSKNKGIMSEALAPILAFGFERMQLYRIEAMVASYNEPSLKLLQKFGFTLEGTLRGHYVVDGINEDSLVHSLLLPEFEKFGK